MSQPPFSNLSNPGRTFRGAPFWAWNAALSPAELRRQIRVMKKMGLGGFFMHSRVGLNTAYLGKDWFRCVNACIDEARKLGMDAWLYDEDRWPSGAAGGMVTKAHPEFRARALTFRFSGDASDDQPPEGRTDLAWYVVTGRADSTLETYRRVDGPDAACGDNETLLIVSEQVQPTSPWHNNGSYLDTLNPDAVRTFLEVTHEAYRARCGEAFGSTVPGVFTDEPNFASPTPWTGRFSDVFQRWNGYDVLDHAPELWFVVGGGIFSKVRLDFKETATQLFVDAFGRLIGEWCGRNGLDYTGHLLAEDSLNSQSNVVGEAMRFYEHMQAPGIDLLTEHCQIFRTAKQCASMARQFGRSRRLTETYGCTGWDFPLEGHKALGDWQMAMGINLRCQHLAWYSMAAAAKRDYPASIFRQSPWHLKYGAVEDYFARIGQTLFAEGASEVRDVLLIHPIESAWGVKTGREASPAVRDLDAAFLDVGSRLLGANIDFDYGSEAVMAEHARVRGRQLRVARARYTAVVLPPMLTIRSGTLGLLAEFAAAGGTVAYVGDPPSRVDGRPSDAARKAYRAFVVCDAGGVSGTVAPVARRLSIVQDGEEVEATVHLMSARSSALAIFVCNTSAPMPSLDNEQHFMSVRDRTLAYPRAELRVFSRRRGDVHEIDPRTGAVHRVEARHERGVHTIPCELGRLESRLFVIARDKPGRVRAPRRRPGSLKNRLELPSENLAVACSEPNVMVLDHPRCAVDGGSPGAPTFVLNVDKQLRAALGAPPRGGRMEQPWVSGEQKPDRDLGLSLTYAFTCERVPEGGVDLAIERPDLHTLTLNGKRVRQKDVGSWMDPAIRRLSLPRLRKGENTLVLEGRYHAHLPGLEAVCLLGRFGVRDGTVMTPAPATLDIGDWVGQGLENYAGNLTYTFPVGKRPARRGRVWLRIPDWRGVALGVRVNGGEEMLLPWPPYEADVTAGLKDARNVITVTVCGHRRNACGPFYLNDNLWPAWTGPDQMEAYETPRRGLVPCGLLAPVELLHD